MAAIMGILILFLVIFIVVVLPLLIWGIGRLQHRRQHVTVENDMVVVRNGVTRRAIPLDELGTAISLKSTYETSWNIFAAPPPTFGIWTWGGLIILNRAGKMIAHIIDAPGANSNVTLDEIPAPVHAYFNAPPAAARGRKAFLREYPGALRPFQLWGATRWAIAITLGIPVAIVVFGFIGVVIVAAVHTVANQ